MFKKIGKYFLFGILSISVLVVGARGFYEVYVYPGEVRKECSERALKFVRSENYKVGYDPTTEAYDFVYKYCFHEKGLEGEN